MLRLATDIGGTFTDLVGFDEQTGAVTIGKASTTPDDLPHGVLDAVAAAGVSLEDVAELVHGTTVVINALTERRGARTALVTTHGFRDVLEIGRGNRPDMYNLVSRKPPAFVPRRHRFEVRERVDRRGIVLRPLDSTTWRRSSPRAGATASRRSPSASCTRTHIRRTSRPCATRW